MYGSGRRRPPGPSFDDMDATLPLAGPSQGHDHVGRPEIGGRTHPATPGARSAAVSRRAGGNARIVRRLAAHFAGVVAALANAGDLVAVAIGDARRVSPAAL